MGMQRIPRYICRTASLGMCFVQGECCNSNWSNIKIVGKFCEITIGNSSFAEMGGKRSNQQIIFYFRKLVNVNCWNICFQTFELCRITIRIILKVKIIN